MTDTDNVTGRECLERSGKILAAIQKLDDRLYRDNGRISIQTRLDRHERLLCGLVWALSVGGGALIVGVVGIVLRVISP